MRKLDVEQMTKIIRPLGRILAFGAVLAIAKEVGENPSVYRNAVDADYNDAIAAIMDSDLFSSDKQLATMLLKRDGDVKYYKAVITIVNDTSMFASDKVETIKYLSEV